MTESNRGFRMGPRSWMPGLWRGLGGLASAFVLAACSGCRVGPDFERPDVPVGDAYLGESGGTLPEATGDWWGVFGDPVLDGLMERLDAANPGLAAAVARYDAARAALGVARSEFYPQIFGDASGRRERATTSDNFVPDPRNFNRYRAALELTYEIDLWGRVRRSVESAAASMDASGADLEAVRLALKAELAQTYFQLRYADEEVALLERTIRLREENADLIGARVEGGEANDLDLARARTELETARADQARLRGQRAALSHALAALVGEVPSAFDLEDGRPPAPPVIPAGVPSELLIRRPDVFRADRELAAATARVGIVWGSLLPRFEISGVAGYSSLELSDLIDPASVFGQIGPQMSVPLFRGSQGAREVARAKALVREAAENYRDRVLSAVRETEDALAAIRWLDEELGFQERAVAAARDAARLARLRYDQGLDSYLAVVDAERTALQEERNLTQGRSQRHVASVRLVRALGGGWVAGGGEGAVGETD